ncbi:SH3 domain-containing protein [Xenorhabdus cabanillasii]|uniref:Variant SH3 domain protein n=1 Tax=Xenorhabdus cabanillasii JM26 TaxID=1427517 RepID=W1JA44_9GAMM|nr:SH3 domain-containing protein [Xenorhabdus cabanillasii]PHM76318.1 variant SH3 domain protein [Xenorhabdus cabanillasii JM26]CDL86365.1 Variant SH3 domain protein [Xenorhabdus cabanillasii JM26]
MFGKGIVIKDYVSAYPNPIRLQAGDVVVISHSDIEYPYWVWVTDTSEISGWVPRQILCFIQANQAICTENYIAHELTVKIGECLYLEKLLNGWFLAHKRCGETGWIPQSCVEL